MPRPLIIFPHRHPDSVAIDAMKQALRDLKQLGYDTLCTEYPSDLPEQQIVDIADNTVQEMQNTCDQFLRRHAKDIPDNFSVMSLEKLSRFIDSKENQGPDRSVMLGRWFKELPGTRQALLLLKEAQSLSMEIRGFDLEEADLAPMHSRRAQMSVSEQAQAIRQLDDQRTQAFADNLLEAQKTRGGVVCAVGQYHYAKLAALFSKMDCLNDVLFVHPYSSMLLNPPHDDRRLPSISHDGLSVLDDLILESQPDAVQKFIARLNRFIADKMGEYRQIVEPTIGSINLAAVTGLPFDLWMRPSGNLDAYVTKEGIDISAIEKKLKERKITGLHVFFKGHDAYCVPCLNSTEINTKLK